MNDGDQAEHPTFDARRAACDLSRSGWPILAICYQMNVTSESVVRWITEDRRAKAKEEEIPVSRSLRDLYVAQIAIVNNLASLHIDVTSLRSLLSRVPASEIPVQKNLPMETPIVRMILYMMGQHWPEPLGAVTICEYLWMRDEFRARYRNFTHATEAVRALLQHMLRVETVERVGKGEYRLKQEGTE